MCSMYEYTFKSISQLLTFLNTWYSFYNYADINEVVTVILGFFLKQIFTCYLSQCCFLYELKLKS